MVASIVSLDRIVWRLFFNQWVAAVVRHRFGILLLAMLGVVWTAKQIQAR